METADQTESCPSFVPWLILATIAAVAAGVLAAVGAFTAVSVNDTPSYADFDFSSVSAILSAQRTPGYPLLLAGIRLLTGSYAIAPAVHFLLFCGGVALFQAGLLAHGGSRWTVPWIAGSLCSAFILARYQQTLATDTTAAALGVACCGALLLWTAGRDRAWLWGALVAVLVCTAWLVRPAMLSLAPFVMLAAPLLVLRRERGDATRGELARWFCVAVAITLLPLGAWCGLRYLVVGKFGIVSFGGYNLIGVAGQFLDEPLVAELPAELRPLATAALARRAALPAGEIALPDDPVLRYSRLEANYDVTIWKVFVPAAREVSGGNATVENTQLKELGMAIIRLRPAWYAEWIVKATRQAMRISVQELIVNPVTGLLLLVTAIVALLGIIRNWIFGSDTSAVHGETGGSSLLPLLFCLAVLYAGLNLLLVIAVCPPLGRMTDAACVLFPPFLTAVFCDRLRALWR